MLLTCIMVGVLAQKQKKRTGAAWGFLTFVIYGITWVLLYFVMSGTEPDIIGGPDGMLSLAITVAIIVGGIMLLIVATLPKRD